MRPDRVRFASRTLIALGGLLGLLVVAAVVDAKRYQNRSAKQWDADRAIAADSTATPVPDSGGATTVPPESIAPEPAPPSPPPPGESGATLGRFEIPRLDLAAMVLPGVDRRSLRRGIGHIAGTAAFGAGGNVGLAGHRDTFFRRLADVVPGDTIRIATLHGGRDYAVRWTRVVEPSAVDVLDPTPEACLTLVTCYPFAGIGPAPRRWVVRATAIGAPEPVALPALPVSTQGSDLPWHAASTAATTTTRASN